jgi:hypothetical protein
VRETPTATWEELIAFRAAARKLGYVSVSTAALLAWEWLQREEHVFGGGLRSELSFTSFRHGGFTEGADSDLTDAELPPGRHRSTRQLPTYAKRRRKQLISGTEKRREERTKAAGLSE